MAVSRFFRSLLGRDGAADAAAVLPSREIDHPPEEIHIDGASPFPFAARLKLHHGLPIADWEAVQLWLEESVPAERRAEAWMAAERAWMQHVRAALGAGYRLDEGASAIVLSSLDPNVARVTATYMEKSLRRILAALDGIAQVPDLGKDLLLVFDTQERYYEYVSYYYPEEGEYAFSGGMHINWGCGHYATVKDDLRAIEPTIVHEMTHGCLAHLPIPAWLNEGIAVNTERRFAAVQPWLYTPEQMHAKHQAFWGDAEIQEFWTGKSFLGPDEGNMLSYDLARVLVDYFARDWEQFKAFTLAAERSDGGSKAAQRHLPLGLGAAVCAVLQRPAAPGWEPAPERWEGEPEKGAFDRKEGYFA
jgi:hypothetical protein